MVDAVADELDIIERWLVATLSGRTELTDLLVGGAESIHNSQVPTGALGEFPAVVFQHQGSVDVRGNGPATIGITGLWLVKGVVEGRDFGAVSPIAAQIQAAINMQDGSPSGGFVFACTRESRFSMPEHSDDDHDFRHRGGIYRIFAQASS